MDEAGARARIGAMTRPPDVKEIEKEIEEIRGQKEAAIKAQDFEKAAALRDNEKQAKEKLERILTEWREQREEKRSVRHRGRHHARGLEVDRRAAQAHGAGGNAEAARDGGRSAGARSSARTKRSSPSRKALRRSRADLKDPRRPIGSFIFLGPTGVGKTFLAQTLAEFMFGDRDALIQIDMSEYMEKFTASRLIGSPPGYVGYEEGGQLSEAVRRRPYSVVLFDEIEKAHPDVMHLLLQILEEGKVTDSLGRKIDFRNTIIIMTSNIGAELIKKSNVMGFGALRPGRAGLRRDEGQDPRGGQARAQAGVRQPPRRPHRLPHAGQARAAPDRRPRNHEGHRADQEQGDPSSTLDEKAKEFLIEKGYDPQYGARPMRRAVERYLEDPMAEEILRGNIKAGDTRRSAPTMAS